ncbi:MAG: FAD-dependent oxidoreductase [Phycisphaerales bacterium]|nr:FAD-dependent oxidoreductase [Phycisphaerales bacterium]
MRIAVVGAGVSGLVCAYLLAPHHDVTLYEQEPRPGGHTNTLVVRHEGRDIPVDTGFIVFNQRNYPNFCRLLDRLGVASRPTTMSFSVRDDAAGFEYGGSSAAGLLGAPSNLLRPRWWRLVGGIAALGRRGKAMLAGLDDQTTIGDLCDSGAFSRGFLDDYLLPMAAAIWSAPQSALLQFPAHFFLRFFDNHGMLDLRERPRWRTIVGGSQRYVEALLLASSPSIRTACRVTAVSRRPRGVAIQTGHDEQGFDVAILAAHADQSLAMLADPTEAERAILGAMPYQPNEAVLHTDCRLLPRRRRCWAAWNARLSTDPARPISVTYNMSLLQGLDTATPLCVTLNETGAIDPTRILARCNYDHPLYTLPGEQARARWGEISGRAQTHYCGAYWGSGFHEDGVASALRVCAALGATL